MTTDLEVPSVTPAIDELTAAIEELQVTAHENPAVARCAHAFLLYYEQARARGDSDAAAKSRGRQAYRLTLPPLAGSRNVRDFIACITHGMLLGYIDREEASKLFYAAQVAHTTRRPNYKTKNTVPEPASRPKTQLPNQPSET